MKKIFLILVAFGFITFSGCSGPEGPRGATGYSAESEVFELQNVNFSFSSTLGYNIFQTLNPQILASDVVLIYRLSGTIDSSTPIWQSVPRTIFLTGGKELDYDFDFSKQDFTIYATGNFDISTAPQYLNNQTFRIVIIPGYFSNKSNAINISSYNDVVKAYKIDDSHVTILNKK